MSRRGVVDALGWDSLPISLQSGSESVPYHVSTPRPVCCLWHHQLQRRNHSPLILSMALFSAGSSLTRSFRVKCDNNLSSLHTWSDGFTFRQSSVLGPLPFIIHTSPLSALISSFSQNNHFYADDTRSLLLLPPTQHYSHLQMLLNRSLPGRLPQPHHKLHNCQASTAIRSEVQSCTKKGLGQCVMLSIVDKNLCKC